MNAPKAVGYQIGGRCGEVLREQPGRAFHVGWYRLWVVLVGNGVDLGCGGMVVAECRQGECPTLGRERRLADGYRTNWRGQDRPSSARRSQQFLRAEDRL